jgi:cobalt-zinc-cadmium efflux system outer membrane protein
VTVRGGARGLLVACMMHASVAGAEVLTESRVLASARANFPAIVAAEAEKRAAEGELLASEGGFDPLLRSKNAATITGPYENARTDTYVEQPTSFYGASWFAGWRLGHGYFPLYDGKYETGSLGEARVGASVPLLRNRSVDRRRATLARAERSVGIAETNLDAQRIAAVRNASFRYWDWVLAGERQRLAKQLLEIAEFRRDATERRAKHGEIQASEVLENERGVLQRRSVLASAERSLEAARYELSLYVRDETGAVVDASAWDSPGLPRDSAMPLAREAAVAKAEAARPELRRLEHEVERERIEARFADDQTLVAADVGASTGVPIGEDNLGYRAPRTEVTLGLDYSPLNRAWKGRRAIAEAAVARAQANLGLARDRVRVEVDDALSAWKRAGERAAAAAAERDLAQELARLERTRFEMGDGTLFLVNLREQIAFEAELRDREARADQQRALAQFRAAIGER